MKTSRKTAIEPIFDLLSKLLATTGEHKPLPIRGIAQVSTFLPLGVLILQIAMLINKIYRLPLRIKNLTELTSLLIPYNQIKNISPVENLTNLSDLGIIGNPIQDKSPVY